MRDVASSFGSRQQQFSATSVSEEEGVREEDKGLCVCETPRPDWSDLERVGRVSHHGSHSEHCGATPLTLGELLRVEFTYVQDGFYL